MAMESTTTTTSGAAAATDGGAAATATTTTAPAAASDWTSGLNEDLKGYAQFKKFTGPDVLLDSYRQLEKYVGTPKERLIKLPENMADEKSMAEIYDRLGRPKDPTEYGLKKAEGSDGKFQEWAQATFHKLGLNKAQGEKLAQEWEQFGKGVVEASSAAVAQREKDQVANLQKEWGAAFDQNMAVVDRAAERFGISAEDLTTMRKALGPEKSIKLLHQIGSQMGEAEFVTNNNRGGFGVALTPQAAQSRIQELRQDPGFIKRYTEGDVEARAEMEKLHKFATAS